MMSGRDWRAAAAGAGCVLALGVTVLAIQHVRQAWPFSLHHEVGHAAQNHATEATREGDHAAHARTAVELSSAQLDAIGVRLARAGKQTIAKPLRAVATVVPDEARISHVHTRVAGWIEELHINTTGQVVRAGQPLAGIFSQELLSTQREYLSVRRSAKDAPSSMVLESARARLRVLGMTDADMEALERAGQPSRLVIVSAPRNGVVIHRGISVGTAVDPSTELLTIADLSRVWLVAEVPEQDVPGIHLDTPASIHVPASGRPAFQGKVEFLYPTLSERTRTLRVRFALDNRDGALRPGLYGTVDFHLDPREALTVPRDAVVDTGEAQHVFVVEREGRFVPRTIRLGISFGDSVEVAGGLREGETVVASGVFLIDSESRLRASGAGTGHAHGSRSETAPTAAPNGREVQSDQRVHPAAGAASPSTTGHEGHVAP